MKIQFIKLIILTFLMALLVMPMVGQSDNHRDTLKLWVNGACGMCEDRIERTALGTRGVATANWDSESKLLALQVSDRFKSDRLHYNLASVGHDTREMLAPDPVYNALPACCHYRPDDGHNHDHTGHDHALHSETVRGRVIENTGSGRKPLPGANIYWSGTSKGVITDEKGLFEIQMDPDAQYLVVSYIGFGTDSLEVDEPMAFEIEFNGSLELDEVQVVYRTASTEFKFDNPYNVQVMNEKELLKAACCNLSESFETNPAVDVSFTDAVTGTRQIEMLGLAGPYVQITRENMPDIRGLSSLHGLTYVPGPWIEGIQLNTGTGSVVNGFESITGQINVELRKPEDSEKLYVNLFGNEAGRLEANLNTAVRVSDKWQTGVLLHARYQPFEFDHNQDGFMDHPAGNNAIFVNRWKYSNGDGLESQAGIKGTFIRNRSGQIDFDHSIPFAYQSFWGSAQETDRFEGWFKIGKVFPDRPFSSLGFQMSGVLHDQYSFFGERQYDAWQRSFYANLIYQGIISNTNHQFRTGASFQYDKYSEDLNMFYSNRKEVVPGAFFEYTYNFMDKFSAVSGLRSDYHNTYGLFFTPRLHLRYAPAESTVFKAMVGRGLKTANIIAENIGFLASQREIYLVQSNHVNPYGLEPEVAWNTGLSAGHEFLLGYRQGTFKVDYYYTWFENQVIVDYDSDPSVVVFRNLDGKSFSHSLQVQLDYELFSRYDIRLAYRHNDVRSTIAGRLQQEIFTPKHRAFVNMAYETMDNWKFDMTFNWQGIKRIPSTAGNPEEFQLEEYSPDFFLWNAQVSKSIGEVVEVYLGAENILNFRQENPIIDAENPFGDYFDASLIWGPIFGRKIYGGLRIRIR